VLQEALEEEKAKASSSSGWFGSGTKAELLKAQQQLQVVKDELEVKIRENEELHMRIFESGQETGTIKEDLQERISRLKAEVRAKTEELEDLSHQTKHAMNRLTSENTSLQTRSEELSDTLVRTKSLMQQREHTMTLVQQQLSSDLASATLIIESKLPFNDTADPSLNRLNIPSYDHLSAVKRASITSSAITLFKKFIGFWKEWCDAEHEKMLYMNRSSSDASEAQRQINRKLGTYLSEFQQILPSLVSSYGSYMATETFSTENDSFRQELLVQLINFVSLHERASLAFKARLEGESSSLKLFTTNESARTYNSSLVENWTQSHSQLETLASYFSIFATGISPTPNSVSPSTSNALFALQRAYGALETVKSLLKERVTLMQQLFALEQQVDSFMPNDVKVINNHRLSALGNASAMLDKICEMMNEYLTSLAGTPQLTVRSARCDFPDGLFPLERLSSRSRRYLASMRTSATAPISIPYAEQLKHVDQIAELSGTVHSRDIDITALKQQLMQHASIADRVTQELRSTKAALSAAQSNLKDAHAEVAELKHRISYQTSVTSESTATTAAAAPSYSINDTAPLVPQLSQSHESMNMATTTTPPPPYQPPTSTTSELSPPSYDSFLVAHSEEENRIGAHSTSDVPGTLSALSVDDLMAEYRSSSASLPLSTSIPPTSAAAAAAAAGSSGTEPASSVPARTVANVSASVTSPQKPWSLTVFGEDSFLATSLELGDPDLDREESVRRFYEQRTQQFQSKVDAVDKKNVELYQQALELEKRLKDSVAQRDALKQELDTTVLRVATGSEELETTRANYDQQLKTLTEHMVGLSDKIGEYEEQLSVLKNSTVRCGKCKAWNTIEWLMGEGKMGQRCSHGNHPSSFNYA